MATTRTVDRADYARILLGVRGRHRTSWMLSTAFAESVSALGARVEQLLRLEPERRTMRTLMGGSMAAALVFTACKVPAPPRNAGRAGADFAVIEVRKAEFDASSRSSEREPPLQRFFEVKADRSVSADQVEATFRRLFSGITLVEGTAARARQIIRAEETLYRKKSLQEAGALPMYMDHAHREFMSMAMSDNALALFST